VPALGLSGRRVMTFLLSAPDARCCPGLKHGVGLGAALRTVAELRVHITKRIGAHDSPPLGRGWSTLPARFGRGVDPHAPDVPNSRSNHPNRRWVSAFSMPNHSTWPNYWTRA
jgi:hypothetical protein